MVAEWPRSPRPDLGWRRRVRLWLSRFVVVIVFVVGSVVLTATAVEFTDGSAAIPTDYEQTTYAIRGELPEFDEQRVLRVLPILEAALPSAVRLRSIDDEMFDRIVQDGEPTFTWTTVAIDLASPSDASGRRLWEIEVQLGGVGDLSSSAVVTLDGPPGPRFLYRIDSAVVAALREASGLGATP